MIDGISITNLNEKTKLHIIKSNKFKTDLIGVYIKRPLNNEEATKNTLITRLLDRATRNYKTSQQLNTYLEELYGAILVCDVVKYGDKQVLQFKLQFPNKNRISDKEIFRDAVEFANEVVNYPCKEGDGFIKEYFDQEKENLRKEILSRTNDKMSYAIDRCTEEMFAGENFAIYQYGDIEQLEKITNEELYEHFLNILKTSLIDICVIGTVDTEEVKETIKSKFDLFEGNPVDIPGCPIHKESKEAKRVVENFKINQGKLTMGYRTNVCFEDDLYHATVLYSYILGGGGSSKLFDNIREKESLCYYIFSKIDKFQATMVIGAGIEFDKAEKTERLIKVEVDKMNEGDFTEADIRVAKDSIISSIRSISDFPNSFINFYYTQRLTGKSFDIAELINRIEAITKEDILTVAEKMQLDIVHFLDKQEEL